MDRELMERLGKEAGMRARRRTSRARNLPVSTQEGRDAAVRAMKEDPPPASHQPPNRYGRTPYQRDSS